MKEQVLSFDKFNNPLVLKDGESVSTLIIRLILLEPGKIQSLPNMGVGLISNWRNCLEEELPELEEEIYKQLSEYLPQLLLNEVEVSYESKTLVIKVVLQNETFIFGTSNFETLKLIDILI